VKEDGRIVGGGQQGKIQNREMEKAPENGKESSHSAHANGMHARIVLSLKILLTAYTGDQGFKNETQPFPTKGFNVDM
jgi:hypothetical protein